MNFTEEQQAAIDRRDGDLLLDAGAGSGKTRVLAERFARSVEEDGIAVAQMLTITFTDKAAGELRERIRSRLQQGPMPTTALETESAWISTIHGFCARILRAHALLVGIDPQFSVLDSAAADELARTAFTAALTESAAGSGSELIAAHGISALQSSIRDLYEELRARGQEHPRLPEITPPTDIVVPATERLKGAAEAARVHMLAANPTKSVDAAREMLATAGERIDAGFSWPADVDVLALKGAGNAFKDEVCDEYRAALESLRQALIDTVAVPAAAAVDELLGAYASQYQQIKRERSALDFEDLQLLALKLLRRPEIGDLYRGRFKRVMVDEAQDTNAVQFALIDAITDGNLFMVGDAQQSIYGFRHADVELFRSRGRALQSRNARLRLSTNFRSVPPILEAVNRAFRAELGVSYQPLKPPLDAILEPAPGPAGPEPTQRPAGPKPTPGLAGPEPLVELIRVPKESEYERDSELGHWRVAEARVLAARVATLLAEARHTAAEIVILTRATTGFQFYEQALAERAVATYVVGGRGYWQHPQVCELLAYLKTLCSRLDTDAWYAALLSPLCGLSLDGLVIHAAKGRSALPPADAERLAAFNAIYERQRLQITSLGAEQLLHDVIRATEYDVQVAALSDGRRRLANIRKLLRLARDHEAAHGPDLRAFLDWVALRADDNASREPEAPLAGEGIDAVRLMTIHASKGLEFPVVCVADLGRERRNVSRPMVRIGGSGTGTAAGLLVKAPGYPQALAAFGYQQLTAEQDELDAAEERRLFYVAMTRAQRRLILSGAANLTDPGRNEKAPIGWITPLIEDQPAVKVTTVEDLDELQTLLDCAPDLRRELSRDPAVQEPLPDLPQLDAWRHRPPPVASLSYSALSTYGHCGLRFRAQYILGLPEAEIDEPVLDVPASESATGQLMLNFGTDAAMSAGVEIGTDLDIGVSMDAIGTTDRQTGAGSGSERGTAIHELLARADLRSPVSPASASPDLAAAVQSVLTSETFARMQASAAHVSREQQFAFQHDGILMTGAFDVFIHHQQDAGAEVIDYKSDALRGSSPVQLAQARYSGQRLIYALAALGTGIERVTVTYLFLGDPQAPVTSHFTAADISELKGQLSRLIEPLAKGDFSVTATPGRFICQGCPIRGTLCPHPLRKTFA